MNLSVVVYKGKKKEFGDRTVEDYCTVTAKFPGDNYYDGYLDVKIADASDGTPNYWLKYEVPLNSRGTPTRDLTLATLTVGKIYRLIVDIDVLGTSIQLANMKIRYVSGKSTRFSCPSKVLTSTMQADLKTSRFSLRSKKKPDHRQRIVPGLQR